MTKRKSHLTLAVDNTKKPPCPKRPAGASALHPFIITRAVAKGEVYKSTAPTNRLYSALLRLAEKREITVKEISLPKGLKGEFFGFLAYHEGIYAIAINRKVDMVEKMFTLAHELGHYALHRQVIEDDIIYSTMEENYAVLEKEADRFAKRLIMFVGRQLKTQAIGHRPADGVGGGTINEA